MKENRETISSIIGERIRKFRTEQKLSQEELAFNSELHPAYIGKVERGEKCPTIETLYKIANGLKFHCINYLIYHQVQKSKKPMLFTVFRKLLMGLMQTKC